MKTYTNARFPKKVFRRLEVGEQIIKTDLIVHKSRRFCAGNPRLTSCSGTLVTRQEGHYYYREITPTTKPAVTSPSMDPDYIPNLAAELGIKTLIGQKALKLALENVQLLDRKQQDYGSQNISRHGEFGVLVRCDDKTARIANLLKKGQHKFDFSSVFPDDRELAPSPYHQAVNESRLDSWLDLANYGLIGALVMKGEWQ